MSSQTPNLNLVLPVGTEKVSRQIINDNNTKIDTAVGSNSDAITNLSNKVSKEVTNLNDQITNIPENGNEFAYYGSTASNKPGVNSGYVQATKIGNWALQFAVDLEGTPYTRYKNSGGTISAWQGLVQSGQLLSYLVNISFTDGIGVYSNSAIKSTSRIFAIRSVNAVPSNYIVGVYGETGKATIILNTAVTGTITTMIFIDNR